LNLEVEIVAILALSRLVGRTDSQDKHSKIIDCNHEILE
jgi:hypothetical protein